MTGRLVLDTSAVLAFFHGNDAATEALNQATIVYLPSISVGELYFGVRKCSNPDQEETKINAIIARTEAINVDYDTAKIYASIINQLQSVGKRIPSNDIWIAALTIQHKCCLLARDLHITRVEGLDLISL